MESNFHRIKFNCEIVFSLSLNAPHSKQIHAYFNFHQTLFCWNDKFAENVAAKKLILFFCLFALFSCMFAEVHLTATSWRVKSPEFKVEFLQRSTWLRVEWFTCSLLKLSSKRKRSLSCADNLCFDNPLGDTRSQTATDNPQNRQFCSMTPVLCCFVVRGRKRLLDRIRPRPWSGISFIQFSRHIGLPEPDRRLVIRLMWCITRSLFLFVLDGTLQYVRK